MGIWLAVAMQVLSSFAFAGGAILQQLAVKSTFDPTARASSNQLTARGMLNLLRIPRWLLGLSLVFLGALIHLSALSFAPVTIVQPIGILAVPWAVIIAAKIHKHPLSGKLWAAVGVTIAGVAGFTLFSTTYATAEKFVTFPPMLISFAIVCVLAALLAYSATKAAPWARAMLWAATGATFYGLASGFMKTAIDLIVKHGHQFDGWRFIVTVVLIVVCFVLGVWLIQQGYASGPAEITVGTMTTVDPLIAVLFGLIVLGEGGNMGIGPMIGMALTGAVAVYGVVMLSKEHPDAIAEREAHEAEERGQSNAGPH